MLIVAACMALQAINKGYGNMLVQRIHRSYKCTKAYSSNIGSHSRHISTSVG
jgi:hypothetical protein